MHWAAVLLLAPAWRCTDPSLVLVTDTRTLPHWRQLLQHFMLSATLFRAECGRASTSRPARVLPAACPQGWLSGITHQAGGPAQPWLHAALHACAGSSKHTPTAAAAAPAAAHTSHARHTRTCGQPPLLPAAPAASVPLLSHMHHPIHPSILAAAPGWEWRVMYLVSPPKTPPKVMLRYSQREQNINE
jgi:hypothetical protein